VICDLLSCRWKILFFILCKLGMEGYGGVWRGMEKIVLGKLYLMFVSIIYP
jgi:hypothetical protein